jgi:predicted TIM-barrel fold metal-dependent hydrolase
MAASSSASIVGGCLDTEHPSLFGAAKPAVLHRPIIDSHVHVFNASDLPGYQFIVQVYFDETGRPDDGVLGTFLRNFAQQVTLNAPDYSEEMRVLNGGAPRFTPGVFSAFVQSIPSVIEKIRREETATHSRSGRSDVCVPQAGACASASPGEIQSALHWLSRFMEYRYQRVRDWSTFIGRAGYSRFAMPALVDYGISLDGQDEPTTTFTQQVALMGTISRLQPAGRIVHGFVPFNPWRFARHPEYVKFVLDEALERQGFIGVKLYPPMGFQASGNDRLRLRDFDYRVAPHAVEEAMKWLFEYCCINDVPIMLHSAPTNARNKDWRYRGDPAHWVPVLKQYPKLRLNFAHFGGAFGSGDETESRVHNSWADKIVGLMNQYPNVYCDLADFDAVIAYSDRQWDQYKALQRLIRIIASTNSGHILRYRLMFGTDWEMLERSPGHGRFPEYLLSFIPRELDGLPEYFASGNAARFIGLDDDNSGSVRRLYRFHAPASAGRKVVDEFRAIAKGQRIQPLRW